MDKRCKCTFSVSVTGDGCRYCKPQTYIDLMEQHQKDEMADKDSEIATLTAQRDRLIGMLKNHHDTLVDITDSNPTLYAKHSSETCVVCKTLAEIEG